MKAKAKFITVEGPIKKGDHLMTMQQEVEIAQDDFTLSDCSKLRIFKAELYAVSTKKIKEGDFPVWTFNQGIHFGLVPECSKDCFRILGKIDPTATWVEEGDKIDIIQIPQPEPGMMMYWKEDRKKTPYRWKTWDHIERIVEVYDFIDPLQRKYIAKVKCKCCNRF